MEKYQEAEAELVADQSMRMPVLNLTIGTCILASAAPSFNFSSISVYSASSADPHPALAMAPPGDVYEREAERVSYKR